jgi:hypothetical protein
MVRIVAIAIAFTGMAMAQESGPKRAEKTIATDRPADSATKRGDQKPATTDDVARQVRRLLRQLDAVEIAARDDAYAELVRLGPSILEHLPEITEATPQAVRDALKRLRADFDKQDADRAMQATQITLSGKGLLLKKVVEDLVRQTGNKVTLDEDFGESMVDLELNKAPFWETLDEIADKAKLGVYLYGGDGVLLQPRQPQQLARRRNAVYTGPLRFEPTRIELKRDPRLAESATLNVGVEISWEPRLQPITLVQRKMALKATDESGKPIPVADQGDIPAMVQPGSPGVEIELGFDAPPRSVKQVASLKGSVELLLPGKAEAFEFANLKDAQKVVQQKHNVTVTLDSVRKSGEIWELRLRIKYAQALDAFDSHLAAWILSNEAVMVTPSGETIDNAGLDTTHRLEDEIGVAYLFDLEKGLDGLKFRYRTPVSIHQIPVEYEFKDITLP